MAARKAETSTEMTDKFIMEGVAGTKNHKVHELPLSSSKTNQKNKLMTKRLKFSKSFMECISKTTINLCVSPLFAYLICAIIKIDFKTVYGQLMVTSTTFTIFVILSMLITYVLYYDSFEKEEEIEKLKGGEK